MVKVKQQQKQLEAKDDERAKTEQAAYDASMIKTFQLKDVTRAFCLKV